VGGDRDGHGFFTAGVVDVVSNSYVPGWPELLRWKLSNSNSAGAPDVVPFAYSHFPHSSRQVLGAGGVAPLEPQTDAQSTLSDGTRLTAALDRVFESGDF
jgi:hypothetical protein